MPVDFNSLTYEGKVVFIFQNIQIVFSAIGLCSNVLTFCVYMRKRLRKYSFSLYMKVLVCTSSVGMIHTFRLWAANVMDANLDTVATFFCKFDSYQPYVCSNISLWLLTTISVDRLLTIACPNRFKFVKSVYFQIAVICVIAVICLLQFIDMPIYYQIIQVGPPFNPINLCLLDGTTNSRVNWINFINLVVLNVFVNNILNVLMVLFINRSRKHIERGNNNTQKRDRRFAMNSIALNLTSSILKLPFSIALMVTNYLPMSIDQIKMIFLITVTIGNLELASSFYINMMVNTVFYNEFLGWFKIKSNRIFSTTSTQKRVPTLGQGSVNSNFNHQ